MKQVASNFCNRRTFLRVAGSSIALAAARRGIGAAPNTAAPVRGFLREHGFWEYTTPCTGGFEGYDRDDYLLALDDIAQAGMNSIVLVVKWSTTGYRSKLPYLDQLPGNKVIESDNKLLRTVMAEAKKRRIKVWLGVVTSYYDADKFGSIPFNITPSVFGIPFKVGTYDPDAPQMIERGVQIFEELLDEFPGPDGLMLEMEDVQFQAAHRIPFYNKWAQANNRPPYGDPNVVSGLHWFDYQTASIIKATKAVEKAVRAKGFHGDLATINKLGEDATTKNQLVNLKMMRRDCPDWATINYTYDKGLPGGNYDGLMEAGITYPKSLGMNVYYLPRGVMTWGEWTDRQRLERSWAQDVADVQRFRPQNLWWFGAGSKKDGVHTALSRLKQMGYADDAAARRALLKVALPLRSAMM